MIPFKTRLELLLNEFSKETESNTPDYVLTMFLIDCLEAFNRAVGVRDTWHGRDNPPAELAAAAAAEPAATGRGSAAAKLVKTVIKAKRRGWVKLPPRSNRQRFAVCNIGDDNVTVWRGSKRPDKFCSPQVIYPGSCFEGGTVPWTGPVMLHFASKAGRVEMVEVIEVTPKKKKATASKAVKGTR